MEQAIYRVPDTTQSKLMRLKQVWQDIQARHQHGTIEHDTGEAGALASFVEEGLGQGAISDSARPASGAYLQTAPLSSF